MNSERIDEVRSSVLDRMERAERNRNLAILGAAAVELILFIVAFMMVDWNDRVERLVFVLAVLSYTIIVLGLAALGAHVTRSSARMHGEVPAVVRACRHEKSFDRRGEREAGRQQVTSFALRVPSQSPKNWKLATRN